MLQDLPSPLLRSFVAVVDCGSLASAAARIGRSESALSLQMARLEDILGQSLFDRDGRSLKLNQSGSQLLAHARAILGRIDVARVELRPAALRPVRLGIVQDFVQLILEPTLSTIRGAAPETSFDIMIAGTSELLQALGEDRLDTALCDGELVGVGTAISLPMRWFGSPSLAENDVIPLVNVTPPCPFLTAAQHALDVAGRPWRLAVTTPSLDGVKAAVHAGLGIACRTEVGFGTKPLSHAVLPDLPRIRYAVIERRRSGTAPNPVVDQLSNLLLALESVED